MALRRPSMPPFGTPLAFLLIALPSSIVTWLTLLPSQNARDQVNASATSIISTNVPSESPSSMRTQTTRDQRRIALKNVSRPSPICLLLIHLYYSG